MALRLKAARSPNYANGFRVTPHPHALEIPLRWKQPRTIFVNSMSDLFHKDVPFDFISKIFDVMRQASHHRFQILTKRSQRLLELSSRLPWPQNVRMAGAVRLTISLWSVSGGASSTRRSILNSTALWMKHGAVWVTILPFTTPSVSINRWDTKPPPRCISATTRLW